MKITCKDRFVIEKKLHYNFQYYATATTSLLSFDMVDNYNYEWQNNLLRELLTCLQIFS